jgi:hypothetical protein
MTHRRQAAYRSSKIVLDGAMSRDNTTHTIYVLRQCLAMFCVNLLHHIEQGNLPTPSTAVGGKSALFIFPNQSRIIVKITTLKELERMTHGSK